jgi:hypothetical protein
VQHERAGSVDRRRRASRPVSADAREWVGQSTVDPVVLDRRPDDADPRGPQCALHPPPRPCRRRGSRLLRGGGSSDARTRRRAVPHHRRWRRHHRTPGPRGTDLDRRRRGHLPALELAPDVAGRDARRGEARGAHLRLELGREHDPAAVVLSRTDAARYSVDARYDVPASTTRRAPIARQGA